MAYTNCDLILSVKDAEDHEKWLKTRDLGIGGSDAAVIMGLNSYKSPYQLWMEKTGQVEPPDLSDNQYVYWGTKNEANIADWFQEETGKKVKRLGTLQSREYPFMLANVDRTVIGENAGLEIKTAGVSQYSKWKDDEIPDAYYCQCLHYMAVTGADYWYIAVLLGGNEARWKRIERNEEDIKTLIAAEKEFWNLMQTKTAPPVDGSLSCSQALASRYADSRDEEIMLPEEADTLIARINGDNEIMGKLKEQISLNQNRLKEMLGDAEAGRVGSFKVTWKTTNGRETCQLSKLKKAAPEFYDAFQYLGSHIAAIMSFTGEVMEHRIRPNEVVLAYSSSGELSVKFGFKLYLPISGESVSVVTPALKEPPATMNNPTGAEYPKFMATQTWKAVQHLLDETEKYIKGRRAQGNLFEPDAK